MLEQCSSVLSQCYSYGCRLWQMTEFRRQHGGTMRQQILQEEAVRKQIHIRSQTEHSLLKLQKMWKMEQYIRMRISDWKMISICLHTDGIQSAYISGMRAEQPRIECLPVFWMETERRSQVLL